MINIGITPVAVAKLDEYFRIVAVTLTDGNLPDEVFAVYYLGDIVGIYLTSDEAYYALKDLIKTLDAGLVPKKQTKHDAALIWMQRLKDAENGTAPTRKKIKLTK